MLLVLIALIGISVQVEASLPSRASAAESKQGQAQLDQNLTAQCSAKLRDFVVAMDDLLTKTPNSLDPLLLLLKEFFPLYRCDFSEAAKISVGSKYFVSIGDNVSMHVVSFNSERFFPGRGFYVSFGIDKISGDSKSASAGPNRRVL